MEKIYTQLYIGDLKQYIIISNEPCSHESVRYNALIKGIIPAGARAAGMERYDTKIVFTERKEYSNIGTFVPHKYDLNKLAETYIDSKIKPHCEKHKYNQEESILVYGASSIGFKDGINARAETHPFSTHDLISFLFWQEQVYPDMKENLGYALSLERQVDEFIKYLANPATYIIEFEMEENQCDGCKAGFPYKENSPNTHDQGTFGIGCTRERYNRPKLNSNNQPTILKATKI